MYKSGAPIHFLEDCGNTEILGTAVEDSPGPLHKNSGGRLEKTDLWPQDSVNQIDSELGEALETLPINGGEFTEGLVCGTGEGSCCADSRAECPSKAPVCSEFG